MKAKTSNTELRRHPCPQCCGSGEVYDLLTTGPLLRAMREAKGWGLRQTARRMGVSPTYLSKLEAGGVKWPTARVRQCLSLFADA